MSPKTDEQRNDIVAMTVHAASGSTVAVCRLLLLTVFRQGRTLLDQGCPNFEENFFGASVHEKIEI